MGQASSDFAKKIWGSKSSKNSSGYSDYDIATNKMGTPFVFKRVGSMYFNKDGDVAHEFYEEIKTKKGLIMKKIPESELMPQGYIELPFPRLNVDFPMIMWEVRER